MSRARQERSSVPSAASPPQVSMTPSSVTTVTWSSLSGLPDPPPELLTVVRAGMEQPLLRSSQPDLEPSNPLNPPVRRAVCWARREEREEREARRRRVMVSNVTL